MSGCCAPAWIGESIPSAVQYRQCVRLVGEEHRFVGRRGVSLCRGDGIQSTSLAPETRSVAGKGEVVVGVQIEPGWVTSPRKRDVGRAPSAHCAAEIERMVDGEALRFMDSQCVSVLKRCVLAQGNGYLL
ncbi:hypothetical protein D3C81_1677460 [compost metagenome]